MTHEIVRFTRDPLRRLNAAKFMLQQYAKSAFVVTTRLQVALPCVAMGTPVLFFPRDVRDRRLEGLSNFVNLMPLSDAMEDPSLFDPRRWSARQDHLALRSDLKRAVEEFAQQ